MSGNPTMSTMASTPLSSAKINRPLGWSSHGWGTQGEGITIYTSGYTGRDETGAVVAGDAAEQTRAICENLKAVLAEAGGELRHITKIICYLVNRDDFHKVQEVRKRYFPNDPPVSTTVVVSGLIDPLTLVEMEAVAFIPRS